MKWLLITIGIWGDGAYTFLPSMVRDYPSEQECLADVHVEAGVSSYPGLPHQPIIFHGFICLPADTWTEFAVRWKMGRGLP